MVSSEAEVKTAIEASVNTVAVCLGFRGSYYIVFYFEMNSLCGRSENSSYYYTNSTNPIKIGISKR